MLDEECKNINIELLYCKNGSGDSGSSTNENSGGTSRTIDNFKKS